MKSENNLTRNTSHNPVEEAITTLFEELQLATRWQRPSILLVTYQSKLLLLDVQISLEKKLRKIRQSVTLVDVNEINFDVPLLLSQTPERQNSIFFVSGLSRGGGTNGLNAYRALNIRRELLVDHNIRTVFWLNEEESDLLPRQALDFWSFRHRVVELTGKSTPDQISKLVDGLTWEYWNLQEVIKESPAGLRFREELLAEIPDWKQAPTIRAELLLTLAAFHWAKREYPKAQKVLERGFAIAQEQKLGSLQSRYWNAFGLINASRNQPEQAISAFKKSIELDPDSANAWGNLGMVYRAQHLQKETLLATKKSLELDPNNPDSWNNLGFLYFDSGEFENAIQAFEKSIAAYKKDPQTWYKLGDAHFLLGHPAKAIQPLLKAKNLNIKDGEIWLKLGLAYRDSGLINKAVRAFYKSARLNPVNATPWKNLGEIYQSNHQLRYARKAFKTARSLDPSDNMVKYSLDACYIRKKKNS